MGVVVLGVPGFDGLVVSPVEAADIVKVPFEEYADTLPTISSALTLKYHVPVAKAVV